MSTLNMSFLSGWDDLYAFRRPRLLHQHVYPAADKHIKIEIGVCVRQGKYPDARFQG